MENKVRFLHTADLHLGSAFSTTASVSAQRRNEALLTLEKIFDVCNKNSIPLMLISGDLFENNSVDGKYFNTFIKCVSDNPQINVVFAAGNHDALTADSPFLQNKLPENLIVLGKTDTCVNIPNLPVRIYGKSFSSVYMKGEKVFSLPVTDDDKINIMVYHGDFGNDISGEYNTVTPEFIENSFMDYIALGHIHSFIPPRKIGKSYFAYPGIPEPRGFDELGSKGVITGEITKNSFKYNFIPLSKRTYEAVEINIGNAENAASAYNIILNTLNEKFGDKFKEKLYKIILTGNMQNCAYIDCDELLARLHEVLFFVKIRDNTTPSVDLNLLATERTLKGRFVKLMTEKISAANTCEEKETLKNALYIGLKAFDSEVKYNEN